LEIDEDLMAHIYSASRLIPGTTAQEIRRLLQGTYFTPHTHFRWDLYYTQHDTSDISTIINMVSYWHPSVSPIPCLGCLIIYYYINTTNKSTWDTKVSGDTRYTGVSGDTKSYRSIQRFKWYKGTRSRSLYI